MDLGLFGDFILYGYSLYKMRRLHPDEQGDVMSASRYTRRNVSLGIFVVAMMRLRKAAVGMSFGMIDIMSWVNSGSQWIRVGAIARVSVRFAA